jgi:DNA-binding transcriptional regulator YiaG
MGIERQNRMTPNQYRKAIEQLGLSQVRAARLLGVDPRTSRRWALEERSIPKHAAILLRLLLAGKITMADIEAARQDSEKPTGESFPEG